MRWTFMGGGNMATSLIGGLLKDGADPSSVQVFDIDKAQQQRIHERFGVHCIESLDNINSDDTIVIAVKPDKVVDVCRAFSGVAKEAAPSLFLSVAAGVTAASMQGWLPKHSAIVRTMPNTPALLGLGATALYANHECTETHKARAQHLLIENMIQSAMDMGLPAKSAEALAIQTALGAATMARDAGPSPSHLRQQVTSKGGTTHAAITTFDAKQFPATIHAAMQAAHDRAVELGIEFGESDG